jgi:hypothetical protein
MNRGHFGASKMATLAHLIWPAVNGSPTGLRSVLPICTPALRIEYASGSRWRHCEYRIVCSAVMAKIGAS